MMLLERMVSSYWRLSRAIRIETRYIGSYVPYSISSYDRLVESELGAGGRWLNLIRYETSIERQFYKALHELQRLQMARQGAQPPAPIAIDIDLSRGD